MRVYRIAAALLALAMLTGCAALSQPPAPQTLAPHGTTGTTSPAQTTAATQTTTAQLGQPSGPPAPLPVVFAAYREPAVAYTPQETPAQAGLENVENLDRFDLSPEELALLEENGFAVRPENGSEFFSLYESNRYSYLPSLVTTDAMLHNYHLYFSHLLRVLEKEELREALASLTGLLLEGSLAQYQALLGTEWENAAARNVGFFTVAAWLLNSETPIPDFVQPEVDAELFLIMAHTETFAPSPVMNRGGSGVSLEEALKEDYTQYIPRGHYDTTEDLRTYFKTMMWYGRLTFRAANEDETKSAALMTLLLSASDAYGFWTQIYEPTNFFVGKSDDLGFYEYAGALEGAYGALPALTELTGSPAKWAAAREAILKLEPPAINSMPIFDETIQPDREREITGFRLMGQRFTLDAAVFQRLVYREVEENPAGERRMLPDALDIPAAFGSDQALALLEAQGETAYAGYTANMNKMRAYVAGLDTADWTQNLYWAWLYTLRPLTEPKSAEYPQFMRSDAWNLRQLEGFLGSWAELKHDTILYAKQVYAEMGGGGEEPDDRGYVEPNPTLYARLAALTRMTLDGLESRGLLGERDGESLARMEELALRLKDISEKELGGVELNEDDFMLIRGFGGQLEHFWLEALRDEGVDHPSAAYENPAALVADVATDPNGQVLQVASGNVHAIYAVVPVAGGLRIARGAVYSYYEFAWPSADRLTDKAWQEMLREGEAPPQPDWTQGYRAP